MRHTRPLALAVSILSGFALVISSGAADAQIVEIIDSTGDGAGNSLGFPFGVAVDASGNVLMASLKPYAAFFLFSDGAIT